MGPRGEGWVIGQFVIGAAILVASFLTRDVLPLSVRVIGGACLLIGGTLMVLGILQLGSNLSPFPKPREDIHALVTHGVYRFVRHPIYAGLALGAAGWALAWGSLAGLVLAIVLFVWFDLKARREEAWLTDKYPEYSAYQARVKKLIPFVY